MNKISIRIIIVLLVSLFAFQALSAKRPKTRKVLNSKNVEYSFLKVKDREIVDASGQPFLLKGMGFGGWMLQEGYMFAIPANGAQYAIKERIANLTSEEYANRFYDIWLDNFITKADVDSIAAWGFNSIRLPMHYNLYTLPIELEPDTLTNTWLERGFALTDSLLVWCKANNLYLIPDLHAAPGGQGRDYNICDGHPDLPKLWESEQNKRKTVAFWRKFAERYKDEPAIAGYDLINEPNWAFDGKNINGIDCKLNVPLWDLYKRITAAIRAVDKNHIIFIEGNSWANNFNGFPGKWDDNMALSFHKYWNSTKPSSLNNFIALSKKHNMPLWCGESGENSNKWYTECIRLLEDHGIGYALWTQKKINVRNNPFLIIKPQGYDDIIKYWADNQNRPSKQVAQKVFDELLENIKTPNCFFNRDVIDAMKRQVYDSSLVAFAPNEVPGEILAVNYDMGHHGMAYYDKLSDRLLLPDGKRTAHNSGMAYRNDGVDIKLDEDGLYVTDTESGEWMNYSIYSNHAGIFDVSATVRFLNADARFSVVSHNDLKISCRSNNQLQQFINVHVGLMRLNKGKNSFKIFIDRGGVEIKAIQFSKSNRVATRR